MSAAQNEFAKLMRDKDRRTGHPEDDNGDDGRSFLNLSEDDDATPTSSRYPNTDAPRPSTNGDRSRIPMQRYGANTGPKGVISDAQDFRDSQRTQRSSIRQSVSLAAQAQATTLQEQEKPGKVEEVNEEDDLEDDEFMQKWRKSRLKEMQKNPRESTMHRNGRQRRLFGGLTTVDGEGYLDAVDNSPADTVVIVYIFDDYSQVSDLIERCIRTLASKHQDTRFVKLHYEDAQMEPAGVPAIIAYRGGEKFGALVPVINEIPDDAELSALTLETVLKRHQILA